MHLLTAVCSGLPPAAYIWWWRNAVRYDDGERETLVLSKERFKLLPKGSEPPKRQRLRPAGGTSKAIAAEVPEGLEDSDAEVPSGADNDSDDDFGVESMASGSDDDDGDGDLDASSSSDAESDASASQDVVPQKRRLPASTASSPAAAKRVAKTATPAASRPSAGTARTPATKAAGEAAEATPRTGQLLGRLTSSTPVHSTGSPGAGTPLPSAVGTTLQPPRPCCFLPEACCLACQLAAGSKLQVHNCAGGGEAADGRFAGRYTSDAKFNFMHSEHRRDANLSLIHI